MNIENENIVVNKPIIKTYVSLLLIAFLLPIGVIAYAIPTMNSLANVNADLSKMLIEASTEVDILKKEITSLREETIVLKTKVETSKSLFIKLIDSFKVKKAATSMQVAFVETPTDIVTQGATPSIGKILPSIPEAVTMVSITGEAINVDSAWYSNTWGWVVGTYTNGYISVRNWICSS